MPNRKKRARLRRGGSGVLVVLIVILICAAAAVTYMLIRSDPLGEKDTGQSTVYPDTLDFSEQVGNDAPLVVENENVQLVAEPTPTPTPAPTATPEPVVEETASDTETTDAETTDAETTDAASQLNRLCPTAAPGDYMLPVFNKALRTADDELMIAITIDKCDRASRMAEYVRAAEYFDIELTFFPTGEALATESMQSSFVTCVKKLGYEIENYVYSKRSPDYKLTNAELAMQLWKQNITLSYILGGDYTQHFFRPVNIESENDQRTHYLLREMGMYGIGSYTYNYDGATLEGLLETLENGNIYRFDMTQKSYDLFYQFVDAATRKGYKCVTLNRLFGLDEDVLSDELTLDEQILPSFDGYVASYYELKVNTRSYAVFALQRRLYELGYLKDPAVGTSYTADGLYGQQTSIAVSAFQARCGLAATGNADVETQERLYADDAPVADY